jgi:hypothetical protein
MRILVGSVALCAAVVTAAGPAALGQVVDPIQSVGPAAALLDPDKGLRRSVDPKIAGGIVDRLQQETRRGSVWTETLFGTLAVATAEIHELIADGRMDESNRREIAALTVLLVVDRVVELHPEHLPVVGASVSRPSGGTSPIEKICECDRRGSIACGCRVQSTGPGSCEYRVMCPSYFSAGCSAVNIELCIADTILGIFTAKE